MYIFPFHMYILITYISLINVFHQITEEKALDELHLARHQSGSWFCYSFVYKCMISPRIGSYYSPTLYFICKMNWLNKSFGWSYETICCWHSLIFTILKLYPERVLWQYYTEWLRCYELIKWTIKLLANDSAWNKLSATILVQPPYRMK